MSRAGSAACRAAGPGPFLPGAGATPHLHHGRTARFRIPRAASRARHLAAAALVGFASLFATAAQAQTTYVSNLEQTAEVVSSSQNYAQSFTTGSVAGGYALGSVDVSFSAIPSSVSISASIYSSNSQFANSASPDSALYALTNPLTLSGGVMTFTAPANTMLSASTIYFVVIKPSASISYNRTSSDTEGTAEAGWSITHRIRTQNEGATSWTSRASKSMLIAVKGPGTANTPATGKPGITGAAQVGMTLTAGTSDIDDDDGLTSPGYTYQWLRAGADISGATSSTYLLTSSDLGETIQVKVDFTDDASGAETLTSDETAAVVAAAGACPSDADWCTTLTVGLATQLGGLIKQYGFSDAILDGTLSDSTFTYGGDTFTFSDIQIVDQSGTFSVNIDLDDFLPRGSVFDLGGTTFTADSVSEQSTTGAYQWDLPTGFAWLHGQEVTVAVTAASNTPATGKPGITGAAQVGMTLTAGTADIEDTDGLTSPGYTYQWLRAGTDIGGATNGTYLLTSTDLGEKIQVKVDFTDDASGAETLTSDETAAVVAAAGACPSDADWCTTLTVGLATQLGGLIKQYGFSDAILDGTLSDSTFTYGGDTFTFSDIQIVDQSGTFSVNIDLDDFLPRGSVFDLGGTTFTADSVSEQSTTGAYQWDLPTGFAWLHGQEVTVAVTAASNTPATGKPGITGAAQVGMTLTAGTADIEDTDGLTSPGYTYQWLRAGTDIGGATNGTYLLTSTDLGEKIQVKVDFTDDASGAETLTSDETAAVVAAAGACPSDADWCTTLTVGLATQLGGLIKQYGFSDAILDGTLSDSTFTYGGDTFTFSDIQIVDQSGTFSVNIDLDDFLPRGSVFDLGGTTFTADSVSEQSTTGAYQWDLPTGFAWLHGQEVTVAVTAASNTPATGKPGITGAAQVGMTLTAGTSDIDDDDGLTSPGYTYQWLRAGTDIGGATNGTYLLTSSDYGEKIQVKVDFTDDASGAETLTSDETVEVAPAAATCPTDDATVWCTTLTVGHDLDEDGNPASTGFEARSGRTAFGSLGGATFTHLGVDYTITTLLGGSGASHALTLTTTPNLPAGGAGLTLHVQTYGGELDASLADDAEFETTLEHWFFTGVLAAFVADGATVSDVSLIRGNHDRSRVIPAPPDLGTEVMVRLSFANTAATGAPAISGTAQVGQTLTASKGTIVDVDGTTKADNADAGYAYTYQWVRVDGGTETPIASATGSTYTLVAADLGKTIKVQARFKDDGDTAEGPLTSAATAAVVAGVGVTVSKSALAVTEQDATGDTYTVVLNSQPSASVTVMVGGYTGTAVTPTPATLTFTTSGWGAPQTVTVTAGDDANTASETVILTHSATSTDSDYNGITIAGVTVTVNDNDTGNSPPTFGATTANRSVAENTAAGQNVGGVLTATDTDLDALTYTLEGTDAASFALVTTSGSAQLRTRAGVTYNHEAKSSYTVVVKADDNNGGTATVTVRITVTDVSEPPGRTAAPSVSPTSGSDTSLDVSWTAPTNTGPAIDNYDLRYRQGTSGNFTNGPQNQTGTSASIGSLSPGTSYEVQVRATNAEGNGNWSPSGTGQTTADVPSETTVTFGASSYTAVEGGGEVTVAVELSAAPSATVTIPLTKAHQGGATAADYSGVPSSVTFTSGQTRRTFTVTAADDEDDDDGESVRLGFGALPSGFAPGARRTATVALVQDAGVSTWYVWFGESDYTVTEGDSEEITLHLNAPWKPELNEALTVPLFDPQHRGGASAADYSGVPESVTFEPGETLASFTVRATDDSADDDDESVLLQFRDLFPDDLEPGRYGPHYTTVHIDDNDGETAVTVSFEAATYTAEEGGNPALVRLLLNTAPGRTVTIPLTTTGHGATDADYTVPSSVTFGASETGKNFTVTATDDEVDDDLESVTLGFGSLPSGVSAGSPSSAVVNLDDNDGGETMLTVNFGAAAGTVGTVKEGSSFFLNFSLDKKPGRKLTIPLEYAYLDGATEADFTDLSPSVVFEKNKKRAGVNIRPVEDFEVDRGEGLEVSFGTLPEGVQVGSWGGPTATFLVIDTNGPPGLSVADASVREPPNEHTTACLDFWVTLDRAVDYDVYVDYATEDGTAKAGEDYEEHSGTLVFWESEREKKKRLCVEVLDDDINESVENMTLVLSNPVGAYLSDPTATGRITSAEGDWAPGGEPEALARVAGLSVEVVAGVLFGDAELSADRRAAFDYLGNRNGVLDLGDLLSWQARCRRGEVHCGGSGSATGAGSPPASPAAPSRKRDGRTPPRRRGGARAGRRGGPGRRGPAVRRRIGWFRALVLGLVVSVLSCDIGENPAHPAQPDPGALHVRLTVPPEVHDIGAMLVVEGPGIDSLSASGFELILADEASSNRREAIIAGSLSTGPVLQVWVPDRHQLGRYRVKLVQVAGDDYGLKDLTRYGIAISR